MRTGEFSTVEVAELVFKIMAGLAAAIWAFWIWRKERKKDREGLERERKRRAALYLIPYLFACEELQSRIWNILDNCGLESLRGSKNVKKPDLSYVEETLYLIVQYFGWQHCVYRYYVYDARIMQLALRIRDTFATDKPEYGGKGAFCFFRPKQRFLAQMIMQRSSGELGGELDVISFEDFKKKLNDSGFSDRPAMQKTCAALSKAAHVKNLDLKVRKRLATIQWDLVKLLEHIEDKEGISVFFSEKFPKRQKVKAPILE